MPRKFHVHGRFQLSTTVILDNDPVYLANMSALCRQRPNPTTFRLVRDWLVKSSKARYYRKEREMSVARHGAARLERQLAIA